MTVTYVRLKNRRGNKADLPKPLAEGELGFALDTRELYIGGGDQNSKNRMVQVGNYLNAQTSVQSDLDNRLIYFSLSGTQSYVANGSNANSGSLSLPTGASISSSTDFVVTKYNVNNYPATQSTDTYTIGNVAVSTFDFNFTSTNIPEANSVIVVSKWTETATRSAITTALSLTDPDNELFLDVTTGTGFVDIGTSGNATATISALTTLDQISDANVNTNINILGWSSDLPYSARSFSIDGERLIEVDSPKQAKDLSTFLNSSQGSTTATVANNIKVYTQDSRPDFDNNFYINPTNLNRQTLTAGQTNQVVTSFAVATVNTLFVDYSFKHGSAYAIGQLRIISDGTNAEFVDDRTETANTSDITFSVDVNSNNVRLLYTNAHVSQDATISYVLKRWLTQ